MTRVKPAVARPFEVLRLALAVVITVAVLDAWGGARAVAQELPQRGYDDLVRSALLHAARGDNQDAHRDLRWAIDLHPERPDAYRVLGELRRVEAAHGDAITLFQRCAELAEARIGQEGTDPAQLLFAQGACLFGVADTLERVATSEADWRAAAEAWRVVAAFAEQQAESPLGPWAEARLVAIAAAHPEREEAVARRSPSVR